MENSSKENKTADLAKYQREYMKKRYHDDVEKSRLYKNSLKAKKLYNMSAEDLKIYGEYLADFCKLKIIKEKMPKDLFEQSLFNLSLDEETKNDFI